MSEPPSSSSQPPPHLPFSATSGHREYRKGNWTLQETLTIITAKKLDDERRSKPILSSSSASKPGELRWKWVENYCWNHGCFRSQNQCNDKWDNLLRDYKKIREYQSRSDHHHGSGGGQSSENKFPSYWSMDRQQRKYYNLPSNMLPQIFEGLDEVVQRRFLSNNVIQQLPAAVPVQKQLLLPPPTVAGDEGVPESGGGMDTPVESERTESSATESSDDQKVDSSSKRRKVKNIGASIKRSASIIAQTLRNCEEKKEKRHQEVMEYEQRRIQIEETRNEVNKQGMSSLLMAVTKLSTAIQSFISADQN
ncbi:hydroxyproline-rich glycoprotein family protein [Euphorbia peplus]|nr:hydroxyproline-rich glycoprotein family protein [Euphorbia peplus]